MTSPLRCAVLLFWLLPLGCALEGESQARTSPAATTPSDTPTVQAPSPSGKEGEDPSTLPQPPDGAPVAVGRSSARRLTQMQYRHAMTTLLGPGLSFPDSLVSDPSSQEGFVFSSTLAGKVAADAPTVDSYARSAQALVAQVFASPSKRDALVGCTPSGAEDPCLRRFFETFMTQAWVRPVAPEVVDRYLGVVKAGEAELGLEAGLEMATGAMLESPYFLYRAHAGTPGPGAGDPWAFTSWEMADRLALFLWNDLPDAPLLQAAQAGTLQQDDELLAQTQRMLADPKAEQGILNFFREWLNLDELDELSKDEGTFPLYTHTLGAEMRQEIERTLIHRALAQDQDFMELFTSRQVYINDTLRRIYGLPDPLPEDTWAWQEIPEQWDRGGLLTSPGFLALSAARTRTSPTLRGLYVLERLMCTPIQPAPDGLNTDQFASPMGQETVREWNARFRAVPKSCEKEPCISQCEGCHGQMDPIGLMFESFDGLGVHRAKELGQEIDTTGRALGLELANAKALGQALRDAPSVKQCVVQQLIHYANGQRVGREERAIVGELTDQFVDSGHKMKSLLLALIKSDAFRTTARTLD